MCTSVWLIHTCGHQVLCHIKACERATARANAAGNTETLAYMCPPTHSAFEGGTETRNPAFQGPKNINHTQRSREVCKACDIAVKEKVANLAKVVSTYPSAKYPIIPPGWDTTTPVTSSALPLNSYVTNLHIEGSPTMQQLIQADISRGIAKKNAEQQSDMNRQVPAYKRNKGVAIKQQPKRDVDHWDLQRGHNEFLQKGQNDGYFADKNSEMKAMIHSTINRLETAKQSRVETSRRITANDIKYQRQLAELGLVQIQGNEGSSAVNKSREGGFKQANFNHEQTSSMRRLGQEARAKRVIRVPGNISDSTTEGVMQSNTNNHLGDINMEGVGEHNFPTNSNVNQHENNDGQPFTQVTESLEEIRKGKQPVRNGPEPLDDPLVLFDHVQLGPGMSLSDFLEAENDAYDERERAREELEDCLYDSLHRDTYAHQFAQKAESENFFQRTKDQMAFEARTGFHGVFPWNAEELDPRVLDDGDDDGDDDEDQDEGKKQTETNPASQRKREPTPVSEASDYYDDFSSNSSSGNDDGADGEGTLDADGACNDDADSCYEPTSSSRSDEHSSQHSTNSYDENRDAEFDDELDGIESTSGAELDSNSDINTNPDWKSSPTTKKRSGFKHSSSTNAGWDPIRSGFPSLSTEFPSERVHKQSDAATDVDSRSTDDESTSHDGSNSDASSSSNTEGDDSQENACETTACPKRPETSPNYSSRRVGGYPGFVYYIRHPEGLRLSKPGHEHDAGAARGDEEPRGEQAACEDTRKVLELIGTKRKSRDEDKDDNDFDRDSPLPSIESGGPQPAANRMYKRLCVREETPEVSPARAYSVQTYNDPARKNALIGKQVNVDGLGYRPFKGGKHLPGTQPVKLTWREQFRNVHGYWPENEDSDDNQDEEL